MKTLFEKVKKNKFLRWTPIIILFIISEISAQSSISKGDVDGNGVINIEDARQIALYVNGSLSSLPKLTNADVNEDGKITIDDAFTIAKYLTGNSRITIARPIFGLAGSAQIGSIVRIEVFEKFSPYDITGGTVRIISINAGYDSGEKKLTFEQSGKILYFNWETGNLKPAKDYKFFISLNKKTQKNTLNEQSLEKITDQKADGNFSLTAPVYQPSHLSMETDLSIPAPGFSLEFKRVFPQDPENYPYLGVLGRGWVSNFDLSLSVQTDGKVLFMTESGFNRIFNALSGGTYSSSPGDYGLLSTYRDGSFYLKEKNGFIYHFILGTPFNGSLIYKFMTFRLDFMEDPNGNRITTIYDSNKKLTKLRHSNGSEINVTYNSKNRISSISDNLGRSVTYQYDTSGEHLTDVTRYGGRTTSYTYFTGKGEALDHRIESINYPDNTKLYYTFDEKGRIKTQEGFWGTNRSEWSYSDDGTVTVLNATGNNVIFKVNDKKLLTNITDGSGKTVAYEYDSNNNITKVTDQLNRSSNYYYDSKGNCIKITDALSNTTSMSYETLSQKLSTLTDANGNKIIFNYDTKGNLISQNYPDGSSEKYTYDQTGLLKSKTDRKGQIINFTFDKNGLLIQKSYPDGTKTTFSYNNRGALTSATNYTGTINYDYNSLDQLVQVTYPGNRIFRYENDLGDRLTKMTYPDGEVSNYNYDNAGRLSSITDAAGKTIVFYWYDNANRRAGKGLGNGVYTTYDYDNSGRIIKIKNYTSDSKEISYIYYTYNSSGNVITKETKDGFERYTYDNIDQLISVAYSDGTTAQFSYDRMGNRINATEFGQSKSYVTNNLNQYTGVGTATHKYDLNGNLISVTENGQTTNYKYDYENRLISIQKPGENINYSYNPFGLKNVRTDNLGTKNYLWAEYQVAIEENNNHKTESRYLWGTTLDEILSMEKRNNKYFYSQDALNSVTDLTDNKGMLVEKYNYSVFGVPLGNSAVGNNWRYTGLEYDEVVRLQYNRARYYSAFWGRFFTEDPIKNFAHINLYDYSNNNPLMYSDRNGLIPIWNWEDAWIGMREKSLDGMKKGILKGAIKGAIEGVVLGTVVSVSLGASPVVCALLGAYAVAHIELVRGFNKGMVEGFILGGTKQFRQNMMENCKQSLKNLLYTGMSTIINLIGTRGGTCPTFIQLPEGVKYECPKINNNSLNTKIKIPVDGALLRSDIPIFGEAYGSNFKKYKVEYGAGKEPNKWYGIDSSSTPQTDSGIRQEDMQFMQGDIDLHGNLATWNTGLKNWEHLPWHPQDEKIDLNGIYTIKLTVEGRNGEKVEDKVTCEVGDVIAQCLSARASSPDKKVVLHFPEQSLMEPFRVFTIFPFSMTSDSIIPLKINQMYASELYRIKEPGEKFIKDVLLEFRMSKKEMIIKNKENINIASYNNETGEWNLLPTIKKEKNDSLFYSATITGLKEHNAVYSLIQDENSNILSSESDLKKNHEEKNHIKTLENKSKPFIENDFENGFGSWKERDRWVGAKISIEKPDTNNKSNVLKIVNPSFGGNYSVTVFEHSFSIEDYSIMSFDYRIGVGVKTDFYFLIDGRWYNLGFTDDPTDFRNKDVNIENMGVFENIIPDNKWHSVSINLYDLLKKQTRNTRIDKIIMADWDVTGYMKLEFGKNPAGAEYFIDNFKIQAGKKEELRKEVLVDDFNFKETRNKLNGATGIYLNPGSYNINSEYITDGENNSLKLKYKIISKDDYCGYWTALSGLNLEKMKTLSFDFKYENEVDDLIVGMRYLNKQLESRISLKKYLVTNIKNKWNKVIIPLSAFIGGGLPDLEYIDVLFFALDGKTGTYNGTIQFDNIKFNSADDYNQVVDFSKNDNSVNMLGGYIKSYSNEAAVIKNDLVFDHNDLMNNYNVQRITYGGNVGLSYGGRKFSYAAWETDLKGIDVRRFKNLVLRIKGQKGAETPNIYLHDGYTRKCAVTGDFDIITADWKEIKIPLTLYKEKGIDLSFLESLQIVFEWKEMTGTIYIDKIWFE